MVQDAHESRAVLIHGDGWQNVEPLGAICVIETIYSLGPLHYAKYDEVGVSARIDKWNRLLGDWS